MPAGLQTRIRSERPPRGEETRRGLSHYAATASFLGVTGRMVSGEFAAFAQLCRGEAAAFFDGRGPVHIARAPGRLDVMGGIADYSGSVVLEGTIGEAAFAGVQLRSDGLVRVWSFGAEQEGFSARRDVRLDDLRSADGYAGVRALFGTDPATAWAAYLAGAFPVLEREGVAADLPGANLLLHSRVPVGAGVSSSAAIEVATTFALDGALGLGLGGLHLARLCQIVENEVVGAPCGIMDQVTCALGEAGKLLALRCRPHDLLGQHELPAGWHVYGLNSHVKHSVSGSRYGRARTAAFMGLGIIAQHDAAGEVGRYLCNLSPQRYRERFRHLLPGKLRGAEFLERFGPHPDAVTTVDPEQTYSVRACTEHPIYESHRVEAFIACLQRAREGDRRAGIEAGKLMYGSHWSYGAKCALGSRETDLLVRLVRDRGPDQGLLGAKITGGGGGGTVAVLSDRNVTDTLHEVCAAYERAAGIRAEIITGTSPGAYAAGRETVNV